MSDDVSRPTEAPLESWKAIAAYLQRDVRTVRRWEASENLPVHRHRHLARSSVYAYPSELDAWRATRRPATEILASGWLGERTRAVALTSAVAVTLLSVGDGRVTGLVRTAAQDHSMTVRQVWAGGEVNLYGAPSPDGRFLTYTDLATPALSIRDLATGSSYRLAEGSWKNPVVYPNFSRFSPDGRQVIGMWFNGNEQYDLRVVPVDAGRASGTPRVVYSSDEFRYLYPAEWSPDGESILATLYGKDGTTRIALVSVKGGSAKALKSLGWRVPGLLSFSPDGRYIAYDIRPDPNTGADIFVLAADGSREVPLIQNPADDRLLGWAPDGKHILFSSDRTGTQDAWLVEVETGGPKGEPRLVKRDIGRIQPLGFTRNGSFYYGLHAGIRDIYLGTVDPASGKVLEEPRIASQRFLGSNRGPSWSPDGERMAWFMAPGGNGRQATGLYVRDMKTGQERALKTDLRPNLNIRPRWSPDGRWLLVNSRDDRGRFGLYRVSVETASILPIMGEGTLWGVWTADGKSIVYALNEAINEKPNAIRIRNLDTGDDKELYRPSESMFVSNLALSPDGRKVAFGMSTLGQIIGQVMMVLPLDGGKSQEVLRVATIGGGQFAGLDWAPDGKHLFFSRSGHMWRIPAEGGAPEPIALNANGSDAVSVHPDGRRIAFITGEQKQEVWAMQNFLPPLEAAR